MIIPEPAIFKDIEGVVLRFWEYCRVDKRLEPRVAKDYKNTALRFLKFSNGVVFYENVRAYLKTYLDKTLKTYNNQLCGLSAFISRFLGRPNLMEGLKKAHEPREYDNEGPSKDQLRRASVALTDVREKAIFLFYAATGLGVVRS